MTHVIVGGGIAGVTVAQELLRNGAEEDIVVFDAESEQLYSRMLLKEYAKGATSEESIHIHDASWFEDRDIDYRVGERVVDVTDDTVVTDQGTELAFDKLYVTAGGSQWDAFDIADEAENIQGLWTLEETRDIRRKVEAGEIETAVVIGAGFLGLELADALAVQGVEPHFVMRGYWSRHGMGREGAEIVHDALSEHGVVVQADQSVDEFIIEDEECVAVRTTENEIECDWVGLAVGLTPNVDYISGTDAEIQDSIVVDEHMQSDDPRVYAAGDVAQYYDVVFDRYHRTGTWLSAIDQARVAARHSLGDESAMFDVVEGHSVAVGGLDAPVVFIADWEGGDEAMDQVYDDTHYRRIAFENDRPVGATLIGEYGDVVGQLKRLVRASPQLDEEEKEALFEPYVDYTAFLSPPAQ
jgi:NAD(P)H-nitrite reductase large subunit